MCGIVGICGKQEDFWVSAMNDIQANRGPDDSGIFRHKESQTSLAMRRLSIVDLDGGHQPMATQDGRYTIIFNGEIFNAPELRRELEKQGVSFTTDHSDTEVVLQLFAIEGKSSVKKLNGMFAFAIFDSREKTLFLCRDHTGIKPLYYINQAKNFAFASELKALLTLPFVKRSLNHQSLFHYMSLKYIPGQETIFEGIKRLPAGHTLFYDVKKHSLSIERYWKPSFGGGRNFSVSEWTERLREEFQKSVLRWTMSDVSIAASLSGGLDSSAIVGFLAKSGQKVKTYSLGFSGAEEQYWNELPRARKVAEMWHTDHHELIMDPDALLDDLVSMVWHLDEPYAGGLPSWMVFQFMAKEVKVGFTGTGGDELFGNYGKWRGRLWPFPFDFQKQFFEKFYYFSDDEKRKNVFSAGAMTLKSTEDMLFHYYSDASALTVRDRVAAVDFSTQLPEEFLMMTDRFSMAHSLEARTPFLDRDFMELALSVPANIRTRRFDLKYLLRRVVAPVLPKELLHAGKKGFVLPEALWLRGKLRPLVSFLLNPERLRKQGIFQPEIWNRLVLPHIDGRADFHHQIWTILMFQLWHYIYIERKQIDKPGYRWKDIIS